MGVGGLEAPDTNIYRGRTLFFANNLCIFEPFYGFAINYMAIVNNGKNNLCHLRHPAPFRLGEDKSRGIAG